MSTEHADVMLAEYGELKAEQRERIKVRDGLPYLTLGVIFLALGAVVQARVWQILLVVPPAVARPTWLHLRHDRHIVQVRRYIRNVTAPALTEAVGKPVLQWEDDGRKPSDKINQLVVDLFTNTGACLGTLIAAVLLTHHRTGWFVAAANLDLWITVWMTYQMVRFADLRHIRRQPTLED